MKFWWIYVCLPVILAQNQTTEPLRTTIIDGSDAFTGVDASKLMEPIASPTESGLFSSVRPETSSETTGGLSGHMPFHSNVQVISKKTFSQAVDSPSIPSQRGLASAASIAGSVGQIPFLLQNGVDPNNSSAFDETTKTITEMGNREEDPKTAEFWNEPEFGINQNLEENGNRTEFVGDDLGLNTGNGSGDFEAVPKTSGVDDSPATVAGRTLIENDYAESTSDDDENTDGGFSVEAYHGDVIQPKSQDTEPFVKDRANAGSDSTVGDGSFWDDAQPQLKAKLAENEQTYREMHRQESEHPDQERDVAKNNTVQITNLEVSGQPAEEANLQKNDSAQVINFQKNLQRAQDSGSEEDKSTQMTENEESEQPGRPKNVQKNGFVDFQRDGPILKETSLLNNGPTMKKTGFWGGFPSRVAIFHENWGSDKEKPKTNEQISPGMNSSRGVSSERTGPYSNSSVEDVKTSQTKTTGLPVVFETGKTAVENPQEKTPVESSEVNDEEVGNRDFPGLDDMTTLSMVPAVKNTAAIDERNEESDGTSDDENDVTKEEARLKGTKSPLESDPPYASEYSTKESFTEKNNAVSTESDYSQDQIIDDRNNGTITDESKSVSEKQDGDEEDASSTPGTWPTVLPRIPEDTTNEGQLTSTDQVAEEIEQVNQTSSTSPRNFMQVEPELATIREFPFLAISVTRLNHEKHIRCTATIVSAWYVLSAAHCYYDRGDVVIPSRVTIVTAQTQSNINKADAETRVADSVTIYPGYGPSFLDSVTKDLAIIKVRNAFVFNERCRPISLRTTPVNPDDILTCFAPGWAISNAKSERFAPNQLAKMNLSVDLGCSSPCLHWLHKRSLMCPIRETEYSICNGDYGGPLICGNELVGLAQGLVSNNCSEPIRSNEEACGIDKTSIYIYLYPYLGWLSGYVRELQDLDDYPFSDSNLALTLTTPTLAVALLFMVVLTLK